MNLKEQNLGNSIFLVWVNNRETVKHQGEKKTGEDNIWVRRYELCLFTQGVEKTIHLHLLGKRLEAEHNSCAFSKNTSSRKPAAH